MLLLGWRGACGEVPVARGEAETGGGCEAGRREETSRDGRLRERERSPVTGYLTHVQGDNPRERALDMMMGGRLEANVEEDLFKVFTSFLPPHTLPVVVCCLQDLQRPDFMQKDPAERTEEEIRAALEFEKKEAEFLEEREKLRKALEGELRKLQSTIAQALDTFDERLRKLFDLKIKTEMALHQVVH